MPAYLGREREQEPVGAAGLEALVDFTKPWWFPSDFAPVPAPAMAAKVLKCPDHRFIVPEERT